MFDNINNNNDNDNRTLTSIVIVMVAIIPGVVAVALGVRTRDPSLSGFDVTKEIAKMTTECFKLLMI